METYDAGSESLGPPAETTVDLVFEDSPVGDFDSLQLSIDPDDESIYDPQKIVMKSVERPLVIPKKLMYPLLLSLVFVLIVLLLAFLYITLFSRNDFIPTATVHDKTVILISVDGLRWSYLQEHPNLPNLRQMMRDGVSAPMLPVFPSSTFPNHWTLVTGLYPESHGIVDNVMWDPTIGNMFRYYDPESSKDPRWWQGEPIWKTAERQGLISACMFWPGSEVPTMQPTYYVNYNGSMSYDQRIDQILFWLDTAEITPQFITLYLEGVDHAGHESGPDSVAVFEALEKVDVALGRFFSELENRTELVPNQHIILVSDHGMTSVSDRRVVYLEDHIELSRINLTSISPNVGIFPKNSSETQAIYHKLASSLAAADAQIDIYLKPEIPESFEYRNNIRIPPILGAAHLGWSIEPTRANVMTLLGMHGYNNSLSEMTATFIAKGPMFRVDYRGRLFSNLDMHVMIASILKIIPASTNGTLAKVGEFFDRLEF